MTTQTTLTPASFVIVRLRGGDASDATAALAVDLTGCGRLFDRPAYEWRALVQPSRISELLEQTGASLADERSDAWDGEPFGDGTGGTVEWGANGFEGAGLNRDALAEAA